MTRLNRILAALALGVLLATVWLLGWLRRQAARESERAVATVVASFEAGRILHGPGGTALVRFERAEQLAAQARQAGTIRAAIVTRLVRREGQAVELPIVPFTLGALDGADWKRRVAGWERHVLGGGAAQEPIGYLYLNVDRTIVRTVNWAIATAGLAIALVLGLLIARLWRQESSLTRTTIELNARRRELIRLERLALAGQLAAGLLHDLRKPVLHVEHAVEDLGAALGDFAGAAPALQDVRRQTRLFFQLLADSQFERFVQSDRAGEEYVDVNASVEQALALVRYERRGVEVLIRDSAGLPPVLAHPYRLVQLFSNLILNAYQALGGQGKLVIETAASVGPGGGTGVRIALTDNGPGIAPETLPHVFEPFFTTKPEGQGTGLGLSICKLIAEDLRGQLGVESPPEGGATFTVWLPVAAAPGA